VKLQSVLVSIAVMLFAAALFLPKPALPVGDAEWGLLRLCLVVDGGWLLAWAWLAKGGTSGLSARVVGVIEPRPPVSWRWLMALLGVGTVLRVIGLNQDFWIDEIATVVHYLRRPFWETFTVYGTANQHMLYSALGSLSISTFGESEWSARLPAVILGVICLAGLYALARLVMSEKQALFATALLTFSYHHVWFSQNARGYSGMMAAVVWSTTFFLYALVYNRRRDWLAYTLTMTCGILMLQNTAFVFASHGVLFGVLVLMYRKQVRKPLLLSAALSAFGTAALTLTGYSLTLPQIINWYATEDRTGLGWTNVGEFLEVVINGLQAGLNLLPPPITILLLIVAGVILGVGLITFWRESRLITGLILFPPLFNVLALIVLRIGAYPRSFLYFLPLVVILIVRGTMVIGDWISARIPALNQRLGTALVILGIAASAASVPLNYLRPKQDYTGALRYVETNRSAGDVVAAVGLAVGSYRDYYAPDNMDFPETIADLQALEASNQPVWVLYTFPRDMRLRFSDLYDYVQNEYELVAVLPGTLSDGTLYVTRRLP